MFKKIVSLICAISLIATLGLGVFTTSALGGEVEIEFPEFYAEVLQSIRNGDGADATSIEFSAKNSEYAFGANSILDFVVDDENSYEVTVTEVVYLDSSVDDAKSGYARTTAGTFIFQVVKAENGLSVTLKGLTFEVSSPAEPGDVNGDEVVDVLDLMLLGRYVAEWDLTGSFDTDAADFNADGSITSADASALANALCE